MKTRRTLVILSRKRTMLKKTSMKMMKMTMLMMMVVTCMLANLSLSLRGRGLVKTKVRKEM
ncbi:unnamed protein product [Brassica oleracea var. botrytis]